MATVQYEEQLLETIRNLPPEQVQEILDFATFLRQKGERESKRLQTTKEEAGKRMEARRRRIGPIGVKAADLVEEGRAARVAAILK